MLLRIGSLGKGPAFLGRGEKTPQIEVRPTDKDGARDRFRKRDFLLLQVTLNPTVDRMG